jgi:chromate transporter
VTPLVTVALSFGVLSLLAIGGVTSILPEVHRVTVDVHHWLTDAEFTQMFAIAQASPGPNMLIVALIGFRVAGVPGALTAAAAICLPSCTLAYLVERLWQRFRGTPLRRAVEAGLAPITIGLMIATGWLVARGAPGTGWTAYAITAVTAGLVLTTRVNPLWLFAAAGALGLVGLV